MKASNLFALLAAFQFAAASVFAGEWTRSESGREGLSVITYLSDKMLPGEQATIFYTGMRTDTANVGGALWPTDANDVVFQIALTSGQEPITGFEGVSLRADIRGDDLETFYAAGDGADDSFAFLRPSCGVYTLTELPGGNPAQCVSICFRSFDDLSANRDEVDCYGGEAHWIAILVSGRLSEKQKIAPAGPDASATRKFMDEIQRRAEEDAAKNGRLRLGQEIAASNYLLVHVKWKGVSSVNFPIDDVFRKAVWNPQ